MKNTISTLGPTSGGRHVVPSACRRFLDRYSDYRDGRLEPEVRSELINHLEVCACCARYDRVIRQGVRVLRAEPSEEAARPMRVASVRRRALAADRRSQALSAAGSGMTLAASLIVTVLLTAAAWLPFLSLQTPEVDMPPVVASAPTVPALPAVPLMFSLPRPFSNPATRTAPVEIARTMLFEYGHTPARRTPREVGTGLEPD